MELAAPSLWISFLWISLLYSGEGRPGLLWPFWLLYGSAFLSLTGPEIGKAEVLLSDYPCCFARLMIKISKMGVPIHELSGKQFTP